MLAGCSGSDEYSPEDQDGLVAIELSAAEGSVEVTRAGIDATLATTIDNVTFVVFDGTNDVVVQRKTVNYAGGERLYLRPGSYRIFAVANLDDDNCPNGDAAAYLSGITNIAGLSGAGMYIWATQTTPALGSKPAKVPMITGTTSTPLAALTIPASLTTTTSFDLKLRSLYTKVEVNIYNKVTSEDNATVTSGVTPLRYYIEDLPAASWLVDHPSDYTETSLTTLYTESGLVTLPAPGSTIVEFPQLSGSYYNKTTVEVYMLENRRGDRTVPTANDRRAEAPDYATIFSLMSSVTGRDDLLASYILPGKGRAGENSYPDNIENYDIDRNSIYHINVIINGANPANIIIDSRREFLERVVCGQIEDPTPGPGADF